MPVDQQCVVCGDVALFRCQQCGPCRFYCLECFEVSHMHINLFHVAERWEVCIHEEGVYIVGF